MIEKLNIFFISVLVLLVAGVGLAHVALAHDGEHTAQAEADIRAETEVGTQKESDNTSDDTDRAQNHNSSRSNETEGASDGGDLDGDGHADIEVGARDPDDDGDGIPTTESGDGDTVDNASEENERARDMDSDDDGVDDGSEQRANYNNSRSNRSTITKELDKASPLLMTRLHIDKSSPLLYQGVSIRVPEDVCGSDDCDDGDRDISPQDVGIQVSGVTVRGWDAQQKQEVQTRLSAIDQINTANDFGIWVAGQALANENITDIESTDTETRVRYNTQVRLFGFIPFETEATARVDAEGNTDVEFPWYAFLARKGDQSMFSGLAADIRAKRGNLQISTE